MKTKNDKNRIDREGAKKVVGGSHFCTPDCTEKGCPCGCPTVHCMCSGHGHKA